MAQGLPAAWHGAYQPPPCSVSPCGSKGNGLLAARAIAEGEVVFTECPRVCASLSAVPHCAHCCRSTAPPLPGLPADSLQHWPLPATVTCPHCGECYCSEQCAAAAGSYHRVLCSSTESRVEAAAAVVPDTPGDRVAVAKDELTEHLEKGAQRKQVEDLAEASRYGSGAVQEPSVHTKKAKAAVQLRAYCSELVGGALERCAEYPIMALKLIAMAVSQRRACPCDATTEPPCFADALVGATELQWGRYATVPSDIGPQAMDPAIIWALVVDAIGMSTDEQVWAGGVTAVELVLATLCSNAIRITPRSPFDIYMGRVRQEGGDERRAAVRVAVQNLVKDAHEPHTDMGQGESAESCPAGEMDKLVRGICGVSVGAMYAVHSKINHSCDFNCEVEGYHFDNSLIQVVAKRPIQRGMELTTSYVNPAFDPDQRQESLIYNHNFSCTCPRCVNPQRFDRKTGLWVTATSTSRNLSRSNGFGAVGIGFHEILSARQDGHTTARVKDDDEEYDDDHDCGSSSASGGSDMANFVDAFAGSPDDY